MNNYDFSDVMDLFEWSDGQAPGTAERAALGNGLELGGGFGSGALTDEELGAVGNYLAQNGIDIETLLADTKPGIWDGIKAGANSIGNAWKGLGPAGQMLVGSAAAGGLSTYLQNRQRDQELANMSQMSEDQFNRALTLKKAPTNKVANLNHFQNTIKSLRSGQ